MHPERTPFCLLRRTVPLAAVVFGGVILLGRLASVLGALLIFALAGLLVWLPLHSLVFGRNQGLPHYWRKTRKHYREVAECYRPRVSRMADHLTEAWGEMRTLADRAATFLVEMGSGALLGGLLGALHGPQVSGVAVALSATVGLAVGFLVALQRL